MHVYYDISIKKKNERQCFSFKLKKLFSNVYIVRVENKKYLIDTGCTMSVLKRGNYDTFINCVKVAGVNGQIELKEVYEIKNLKLFGLTFEKKCFINEKNSLLMKKLKIDGIIGWDIMSCLECTIDFKKNFLYIFGKIYDDVSDKKHPILDIEINGEKHKALIDSGSNRSYIRNTLVAQGGYKKKIMKIITINGKHKRTFKFIKNKEIKIGEITLKKNSTLMISN